MKKLGILAVALLAQVTFAQTNRFVYQVTSKPDINNKSDIKTENAYLDISAEKSMFYSENRIKRDSVMKANFQSGGARGFNREQMDGLRTNINYSIEKNKKDQKIIYKDRLGRDQYSYEEDRPLNWKILSETTKIGDYKVQKAETDFGGRKWTAWFTTDLPYQDGPYKFSGLPGLVVKAEDSTGDYSFDLMKNYKISDFPEMVTFGNVMKVKRTDYVKQQEKYKTDPASFMSSQRGGGGISAPMRIGGGGNQNPADMRKRMEERAKEEAKRNSNPIELK
ncbi:MULTISPECIES: GLPGLI family protein [Chryseobacterium]|uniref:GLPGLI family protein n=1 Tax=Chryseobacterium TaxID=59732 RepID=UPI000FBC30E8|nr:MULTISPECIES: GLPGLI family protein [Chryseobacterium]MBM7418053.1 GLPGLI family protein [Chryseobacterium sp. JUb44]MDH6212256.1 GLPGLI family protein [Chryseobacterium sp. BIGb0186]WSO10870.1 GLPGLI family protein [Chryseobacterium scophthalmum]